MSQSHESANSAYPPDPTDVQFSTRSLLIIMAVVAVAATALGAFIRSFPADVRLSLAAYWSVLVLIMIGLVVYHARKRYVAEQQAGRVLFVLPTHSYFFPHMPWLGKALLGSFLVATGPAVWFAFSFAVERGGFVQALLNWGTYYGPAATGAGITVFWWRHVRMAERGIVVRSKFVPWESALRWYWDACNKNVVVVESRLTGRVAATVPPEDRAAVDSLLREQAPRQPASLLKA